MPPLKKAKKLSFEGGVLIYQPLVIGLLVYQTITMHYIFPFHILSLAAGQDTAGYSNKDVIRIGIPLTVVVFFITIVIQIPWWSITGLL